MELTVDCGDNGLPDLAVKAEDLWVGDKGVASACEGCSLARASGGGAWQAHVDPQAWRDANHTERSSCDHHS